MPSPILLPQDKALAYVNDGVVPKGPALWKMRRKLRDALKEIGVEPIPLFGPRDVRYRKADIDKLIELKAA